MPAPARIRQTCARHKSDGFAGGRATLADGGSMGGVEVPVFLGLLAIAAIAGFVDAVAGGGGLLQLPPLLALFPASPNVALSTNKVSSICGTSAALWRYPRHGAVRGRVVALLAPIGFLPAA